MTALPFGASAMPSATSYDDVPPTVVVLKTANPTEVPETGADVEFTFEVTNAGAMPHDFAVDGTTWAEAVAIEHRYNRFRCDSPLGETSDVEVIFPDARSHFKDGRDVSRSGTGSPRGTI
mgnify:CR=1 FL=1